MFPLCTKIFGTKEKHCVPSLYQNFWYNMKILSSVTVPKFLVRNESMVFHHCTKIFGTVRNYCVSSLYQNFWYVTKFYYCTKIFGTVRNYCVPSLYQNFWYSTKLLCSIAVPKFLVQYKITVFHRCTKIFGTIQNFGSHKDRKFQILVHQGSKLCAVVLILHRSHIIITTTKCLTIIKTTGVGFCFRKKKLQSSSRNTFYPPKV